jgi:geranylgeranyl pyrophosphate synthase
MVNYLRINTQNYGLTGAAKKLTMLTRFVTTVFPRVEKELQGWKEIIDKAADQELRQQGLASIEKKKFHCLGGSVYTLMEGAHQDTLFFIVALQTISDYLDNLCDRADCLDMAAFRQLHLAFTDALEPEDTAGSRDYYSLYPHKDDGGYLASLVAECRKVLIQLPSYQLVKEDVMDLASLYSSLQTYKHTYIPLREGYLQEFFAEHRTELPGLDWWEFAAATGSTLGIFALIAAATTEKDYLSRIDKKTASLVAACCEAGARIREASPEEVDAHAAFGRNLGMCFQIIDDILDFTADEKTLGKPANSDFSQGILTLPVIYLLQDSNWSQPVRRMIAKRSFTNDELSFVKEGIHKTTSLQLAYQKALEYQDRARACLASLTTTPEPVRPIFHRITEMVIDRIR